MKPADRCVTDTSNTRMTQVSTPGKAIICGEHAVLYGQPALAGALNIQVQAVLTRHQTCAVQPSGLTLEFTAASVAWRQHYSLAELTLRYQHACQRHQHFLAGQIPLHQVLPETGDLLPAALGMAVDLTDTNRTQEASELLLNYQLQVTSHLHPGGGMGASAALAAALIRVWCVHHQVDFTAQQLYQQVVTAEHWQHGTSSGLDPYLCVHGGGVLMQPDHNQMQAVTLAAPADLYGVYTGQPQSSTGECVGLVASLGLSDSFWDQFGTLLPQVYQALVVRHADDRTDLPCCPDLINALREYHQLLLQLGVVPERVQQFIHQVEQLQGAAKISGAGSMRGDAAGLVLVAGIEAAQLARLCVAYDYEYFPLVWQPHPVTHT